MEWLKISIIVSVLLVNLGIFNSALAAGSEDHADPSLPAAVDSAFSPKRDNPLNRLQTVQKWVGAYVNDAGERVDAFFGEDRFTGPHKRNELRVYLPVTYDQMGRVESDLNFKLSIDLPKISHRLQLMVSSFEASLQSEEPTETNRYAYLSDSSDQRAQDTHALSARYQLFETNNAAIKVESGVNIISVSEWNPYIRLKARYRQQVGAKAVSKSSSHLFWQVRQGAALKLNQVFDYKSSEKRLLRSQTSYEAYLQNETQQINQKAVLFNNVTPNRVHAYYLDGQWDNKQWDNKVNARVKNIQFTQFSMGMNWREQLYKDWLFGEIEPSIIWRLEDDFKAPTSRIMMMLEMHFYH